MKLTEKTRANILHFLYLNCIDIVIHPHATGAGGFNRRHAYPVCVDDCKVIFGCFGKCERDEGLLEAIA